MSLEDQSLDSLMEIMNLLDMDDIKNLARTNSKLNRMCKNNKFWEPKNKPRFGSSIQPADAKWFNTYRINIKSKPTKTVFVVIVSDRACDETLGIFDVKSEKEVKEILVNIINNNISDNWLLYRRLSSMYCSHYRTHIDKPLSLYDLDTILNYSNETLKIKQLSFYT